MKFASKIFILLISGILIASMSGVFASWKYALDDVSEQTESLDMNLNEFIFPLFTVTYMIGDNVYQKDYHYDSSADYTVIGSPSGYTNFKQWVNANGVAVTTIPKNNTNNYTLYATWLNKYTINFIDTTGSLIYSEDFFEGTTKISDKGQVIVDKWLEKENLNENSNDIYVTLPTYDLAGATSDIIVRPIYDYRGYLNLTPVYELPDDGVVDYYKVIAVDELPAEVRIPGDVGGVPVKVVERITNIDGESDWDNYENNVTTIIVEENIERIEWNSLAWTPNLKVVYLPNSINYMDKNVFSRNDFLGNDKKTITINFNGTMQEWKEILENSNEDWDGGLKEGSLVNCTDGHYKLEKVNFWGTLGWKEYR